MTGSVNPQGSMAAEASAAEQLEQHLAGLPKSTRRAHTLLGVLALICGAASVGLMIVAIYVSVRSNVYGIEYVPFWWFLWAATCSSFVALFGLSTVIVKADPPYILQRSQARMTFGSQAERRGWSMAIPGLIGIVAFAGLAVYVGVTGTDLFEQFIIGVVVFCVGLGLISALGSFVSWVRGKVR